MHQGLRSSGATEVPRAHAIRLALGVLGTARSSGHATTNRTRGVFVVVQVALAVVLVFSAGLLVRTIQRIDAAPLGFETEGLAQLSVTLPASRYATARRVQQFEMEMLERLRGIHGVDGATATLRMPALGGPEVSVTLQGRPEAEATRAVYFAVAPGFFEFLGVPLREGREFALSDAESAQVLVVSESAARTFWPGGRAVGQRLRLGVAGMADRDFTVVGVVADVRQDGPARDVRPTIYQTTMQRSTLTRAFVFRASRPPSALAADVRAAVVAMDPLLATTSIEMLAARIDSQVVQQRFLRSLLAIFAVIAASLSALGLFAVVSLTAYARRHEFALRMALGARSRQVAWLVVRQALVLGIAGVATGALAASWLVDALRAMLTQVSASDPLTAFVTALGLLGLAVLAAVPPALGAARIDPIKVLKSD